MNQKTKTLELLKSADAVLSCKAGELIFSEGEEGRHMFIIKSGIVELKAGNLVIGTFVAGDIIGEMALVDQERRSATAKALTDCELATVDNPRFQAMILEMPEFAVEVMRTMSARLRHMNRETNVVHRRAETTKLMAMTDPLTGVSNRRAWDERIIAEDIRCRLLGHSACMVSIDLDGLKAVNDASGHVSGDAFIKGAAAALLQACRESDVIARLGGDEFGVLALDCRPDEGKSLVLRIEEAFKQRGIAASIGMAARGPENDLLKAWEAADQAMYAVKRSGKA